MHLTRFTDIGLRTLLYLAKADASRPPVTVAEISRQFAIPQNHLVKVVARLAHLGWLQSQRGRNGGLRLHAASTGLRLGAMVRGLEGEDDLVECEKMECQLRGDCGLRQALAVGQQAFYGALDRYTLADLVQSATGEQVLQMHRLLLRAA